MERLTVDKAFPLSRDARLHVAGERLRAFPFARDEPRQGYVARCPDCKAEVGFVTDEWVARSEHQEPPSFARGRHACPTPPTPR